MKKFLLFSIFFHFFLIAIFYFSPKDLFWLEKPYAPKFLEDSVRVDIVGMPSKTLKELENLTTQRNRVETIDEKKEEVIAKDDLPLSKEENIVKIKKKKDKTKKVKKSITKKESKTKSKSQTKKKISIEGLDELVKMGNQISKGESNDSDKISSKDLEAIDSYILRVKEKVKAFWELPADLIDSDYRCEVQLFISKEGKLLKASFIEKSDSKEFNELVRQVLDKAAPFAKPEKELIEKVKNGLVGLVFPF